MRICADDENDATAPTPEAIQRQKARQIAALETIRRKLEEPGTPNAGWSGVRSAGLRPGLSRSSPGRQA